MGSKQSKTKSAETTSPEAKTISICSKIQNVKCAPKGIFCCTQGESTIVVTKSKNVSINISK